MAERKARSLYECGAGVSVVSPAITPALRRLTKQGNISWIKRQVKQGDIKGADLIVAATNNKRVNEKVSRWAQETMAWVNVVDKTALCDFISPAVFRTKASIVTVYTDGEDPELSRDLKNFLKEQWDDFLSYRNRLQ